MPGVMNDRWIKKMAIEKGMIDPFEEKLISQGVISYGLSSYGYDFRLSNEFMIPAENLSIDPKQVTPDDFMGIKNIKIKLKPNSYILGRSVEYFKIPREVIGICTGKSTYARCGVVINITPLEPEWEGHITISIHNISGREVTIYAGEGIAQVIFLGGKDVCKISYKDRKGKYQNAKGIGIPRIK